MADKKAIKGISEKGFSNLVKTLHTAEAYFTRAKRAELFTGICDAVRGEENNLTPRQKQKLEQILVNVFLAGAQKGAELFTGEHNLFE